MRRWLRVGAFVTASLFLTTACDRGATDRFPGIQNVILVTLDTVRVDHLGCYGRAGDPSPTIDRLAREGVKFEMAISQAAATPISHASILSGRNPQGHGLRAAARHGPDSGDHPAGVRLEHSGVRQLLHGLRALRPTAWIRCFRHRTLGRSVSSDGAHGEGPLELGRGQQSETV